MFNVGDFQEMFTPKKCVAKVEDSCITLRELRFYMLRFANQNLSEEEFKALERQVLNSLVVREMGVKKAKEMGIVVSDQEVAKVITSDPQFQRNGKFDINLYKEFLERTGITAVEYETFIRKELTLQRLLEILKELTYVSEKELETLSKLQNTLINGTLFVIDEKSIDLKVSEEDLKEFFEKNKDIFAKREPPVYRVWEVKDKKEAHRIYTSLKKGKIIEGGKHFKGDTDLSPPLRKLAQNLTPQERVNIVKEKGIYYVIFLEKEPSLKIPSFNEVKDKVKEEFLKKKGRDLARQKALDVMDILEKGQEPKGVRKIRFSDTRSEEIARILPLGRDGLIDLVFSKKQLFGPFPFMDGFAVLHVEKRDYKKPEDLAVFRNLVIEEKTSDLLNLLLEKTGKEYEVDVRLKSDL